LRRTITKRGVAHEGPDQQDPRGGGYQWSAGPSRPPGEAHDNRPVSVLKALLPQTLLADRDVMRVGLGSLPVSKEHGFRRNETVKDPICFSPYLYSARNLVERFFNKIKQCRVATRYDKLAANYLAFISFYRSEFGCALMSPRPRLL
jgi:transposase